MGVERNLVRVEIEIEGELEYDYDSRTRAIFEDRGSSFQARENLFLSLVSQMLANRSPIVLVLVVLVLGFSL
jgi:hypothetical protein